MSRLLPHPSSIHAVTTGGEAMPAFLEMVEITKRFPGVLANDAVTFEVEPGEVHALLGENGAGKSTLMSILYGLLTPTSGRIYFKGRPVKIRSPRVAIDLGIGMVHQHFMLIPALTVVENVILGTPQSTGLFLNLNEAARRVLELSEQYGLKVDPLAKVWQMSVGEQQRVEIIKALFRGADLLILDEPTAVLTPQESEELFQVIRRLTAQGRAVVFITHKLNEVMAISDRVTVLRGGRTVGTVRTAETTPAELGRMMVGHEVLFEVKKGPTRPGRTVLEVENLQVRDKRGLQAVRGVSFEVRAGEVVGLAGVDGNGQVELVEAIAGLLRVTGGRVMVNGIDVTNSSPRKVLGQGVAHIPGDRQSQGLVLTMSVQENAILETYYQAPFTKGHFLDWNAIGGHARRLVQEYGVKTSREDAVVQHLSGGNQQKLILARELSRQPDLLLAVHPTRGLDIGATEFVHRRIIQARDRGCAVLLVSTELNEIVSLSDRIAVVFEGEFMGVVEAEKADLPSLGLMMAGSLRGPG